MEKDRNQRGIESRVIQQRKVGVRGVNDNRSSGHRNYISGASLQRLEVDATGGGRLRIPTGELKGTFEGRNVVQRTGDDDANGKFTYVADFDTDTAAESKYKKRIPWAEGKIQFVDYKENGEEILSAGFSGCFMMVFHFNGENIDPAFARSIQSTGAKPVLSKTKVYVAHVDNKVKKAAIDAERKGLITIEALFRPRNAATWALMGRPLRHVPNEHLRLEDPSELRYNLYAGLTDLTAGMKKDTDSTTGGYHWKGFTYRQERIPEKEISDTENFRWVNTRFVDYDAGEMSLHTLASKAYIYARIILDGDCSTDNQTYAVECLRAISNNNPLALLYSCLEIVEPDMEPNVLDYLCKLFKIDDGIIRSIGAAGVAYNCACTIVSVSKSAPKGHVDGKLASIVASSISTLTGIRENNPKAIRGGSIIAKIKNELEVESELMKFYKLLV